MTWYGDVEARVNASLQKVHAQFDETVYVCRPQADGSEDPVYQEDLTRSEIRYRLLATVQINPDVRTLLKFGQMVPVNLLLTFAQKNLVEAGIPDGPRNGDVLLYRGVRHTVVKTDDRIKHVTRPEEFDGQGQPVADQFAGTFSFWMMANVSTQKHLNIQNVEAPTAPEVVSAIALYSLPTVITLTLSKPCYAAGTVMKRLRVRQDATVMPQLSVAVSGVTVTITMEAPLVMTQGISVTYTPEAQRPVEHGIVSDGEEEELVATTIGVSKV